MSEETSEGNEVEGVETVHPPQDVCVDFSRAHPEEGERFPPPPPHFPRSFPRQLAKLKIKWSVAIIDILLFTHIWNIQKEMGRVSESSALKRKRPDGNSRAQNLTDAERMLLEVIKSKTDMGIWKGDMKKEISNKTLPDRVINKSLNDLKLKQLIKEVPNIHNKTKKLYMAIEFEPSSELTGGEWYTNGSLDGEFINMLKRECLLHIRRSNVSTIKEIVHAMNTRKVCTDDCSIQRITEIVRLLVLDNEVVEVKSTGIGNFMKIPVGTTCYKCTNKAAVSKVGAMASIPCGVCPRIQECTPDGIISPNTYPLETCKSPSQSRLTM